MDALHVGHAAKRTGWSARMLRYLEQAGLVVPSRTAAGYRLYGLRELNQLRSLAELRQRFGLGIGDLAFASRLRREPELLRVVVPPAADGAVEQKEARVVATDRDDDDARVASDAGTVEGVRPAPELVGVEQHATDVR